MSQKTKGESLQKFFEIILIFFRKWKSFSQQKKGGGQYKSTLRQLRQIIKYSGGNDHLGLFQAYFQTNKSG